MSVNLNFIQNECELGTSFISSDFHIFFGNKNSSRELLEKKFSNYEFFRLKQVHNQVKLQRFSTYENGVKSC